MIFSVNNHYIDGMVSEGHFTSKNKYFDRFAEEIKENGKHYIAYLMKIDLSVNPSNYLSTRVNDKYNSFNKDGDKLDGILETKLDLRGIDDILTYNPFDSYFGFRYSNSYQDECMKRAKNKGEVLSIQEMNNRIFLEERDGYKDGWHSRLIPNINNDTRNEKKLENNDVIENFVIHILRSNRVFVPGISKKNEIHESEYFDSNDGHSYGDLKRSFDHYCKSTGVDSRNTGKKASISRVFKNRFREIIFGNSDNLSRAMKDRVSIGKSKNKYLNTDFFKEKRASKGDKFMISNINKVKYNVNSYFGSDVDYDEDSDDLIESHSLYLIDGGRG